MHPTISTTLQKMHFIKLHNFILSSKCFQCDVLCAIPLQLLMTSNKFPETGVTLRIILLFSSRNVRGFVSWDDVSDKFNFASEICLRIFWQVFIYPSQTDFLLPGTFNSTVGYVLTGYITYIIFCASVSFDVSDIWNWQIDIT